ncbi:methyl-accepting chemotaxis protein [Natrarchaeobius sp. A-rgal3]|uniref:methyl-accepting chemotaxis protein n=1 Tax=Natrarchaeobius versutus TaxID=1679078 RepID=UPI00351002ED
MVGSADEESSDRSVRNLYDVLRGRYFFKIGAAILVVTVVLLGAGYVTFADVQASVEADADETLTNAAEREAAGIDSFIADRNTDVQDLSADETISNGNESEIREILELHHDALPENVVEIHYYNMGSNRLEVSTNHDRENEYLNPGYYPWASNPEDFDDTDEVRSFEPYAIGSNKRLGFLSPVEGQSDYAIVIVVDLEERGQLLTSPVDGGVVEVVSTDTGEVTLAEDTDAIMDEYFLLEELPHVQETVTDSRIDAATIDHEYVDEDDVVVATVPLEEKPWAVTVIAPESAVYGTVGDVTQSIVLLIGIAVIGFVAVGTVISRDVNGSLEEMTDYAREIEDGNLDVSIDRSRVDEFGQLAVLFARIRDTLDDQLAEVEHRAEEAEAERERAEEAKSEAETAKADAEEAKAEAEELSHHLEEKATDYREAIDAAADGDLTRRLDTTSESQAMAEIGESVNRMLADVEALVVRIQSVAGDVDARSSDVTASAGELEDSSAEVAESVEQISAGAERQNESLTTAAAEMSDLSATVEEIASSSDSVADQSERASSLGQQGKRAADDAIETIDGIETKADATVAEVETLREEVERIGEIVDMIDDIASETNLLALNASIEAAAAGEDGNGFAVVASEVKSLAEETDEATSEVEQLIQTVEESTESVAEDIFGMRDDVEDGRRTIDETATTLESIVEGIEEANEGIQSINDATDDQADSAQEVATMVDDVATVSEETASESQSVSAAAEQQTSAIEGIAESAESLSERADGLRSLVNRFETDADAERVHSADEADLADENEIVPAGDD